MRPALNHAIENQEFLMHLDPMTTNLQSVQTKVHDILVDEPKQYVTVQMSYLMKPKDVKGTFENDMI
jgi:hypothetical protein